MFSINAKSKKGGGVWDEHGTAAETGAELRGTALPWSRSVCVVAARPREEAGAGPVVCGCAS